LVEAVAALDDSFDEGTIPEEEYHRRRVAMIEQLVTFPADL
jgi:hypothetical protein